MAYKVIWSPKAIFTFDRVIQYLEFKWSEKEIRNFVSSTNKLADVLSLNPYLFRRSEKENIHEVLVTKHNLLLYRIIFKSKRVELIAFFDTRQDPKKK